jgi:hypothetical protein
MPIRLSGELPIQEIATEFGGEAAPNPLSDYYADGTFLAAGYSPTSPAVPSKGSSLNVGVFYGKSARIKIVITIDGNYDSNVRFNNIFTLFKEKGAKPTVDTPVDCTLIISKDAVVYGSNCLRLPKIDPNRNDGFKSTDTITLINYGKIIGEGQTGGDGGVGKNVFGSSPAFSVIGSGLTLEAPITLLNYGIIASGGGGGKGGNGGELITNETKKVCTYSNPCVRWSDRTCYGTAGCNNLAPGGGGPCWSSSASQGWNDICHPGIPRCDSNPGWLRSTIGSQTWNDCRGKAFRWSGECNEWRGSRPNKGTCYGWSNRETQWYNGDDRAWGGEGQYVVGYKACDERSEVVGEPCTTTTTKIVSNTAGGKGGDGAGPFTSPTEGGVGGGGTAPNIATNGIKGTDLGAGDAIIGVGNIKNINSYNIDGGKVIGKIT